ncbi:glycosyltransferase family 20 protein [Atractiella rhizophila]|nr:glycosyltransferase family 20 protein [Atractiella rhizophila]
MHFSNSDYPTLRSSNGRLIVIANRLPITITRKDPNGSTIDEKYEFKMSSGGLVSALAGCKKHVEFTWFGWPGLEIPENEREGMDKKLMEDFKCRAVYLDDDLADAHYNGFANSILWPLFHYHPGEMNFDETAWRAYREANLLFAETVYQEIQANDLVWVQDYHLMLLPLLLRYLLSPNPQATMSAASLREVQRIKEGLFSSSSPVVSPLSTPLAPEKGRRTRSVSRSSSLSVASGSGFRKRSGLGDDKERGRSSLGLGSEGGKKFERDEIKIGFFLHTPFPSSEIYRILPVRREILLGILHCDLIGFHTYDYARHFLSSCTRILGLPTMPNGVEFDGHYAHVGTFPIGIEPTQFHDTLLKESVQQRIAALRRKFEGCKILVGVDRLDYIKGVPQKLHALEIFLTKHPEWIGKVVLVQVAVPSRGDVEEYQNLRASCNEMVGRINGQFGTVEYMPVHWMHKSVNFDELCALYAVSEAAVISSTRDGMNLVSYEYVACQEEGHGVLILSEFAGAAHSLNGSIIANPWNTEELAEAIHKAVTMSPEIRKENFEKLFRYVSKFTSAYWGLSFVSEMQQLQIKSEKEKEQLKDVSIRAPAMSGSGTKTQSQAGGTLLPSQREGESVDPASLPEDVVVKDE